MGKSQRSRPLKRCKNCLKEDPVLHRVKIQHKEPWAFMCSECQKSIKTRPTYQYGGTWKQDKRN